LRGGPRQAKKDEREILLEAPPSSLCKGRVKPKAGAKAK